MPNHIVFTYLLYYLPIKSFLNTLPLSGFSTYFHFDINVISHDIVPPSKIITEVLEHDCILGGFIGELYWKII